MTVLRDQNQQGPQLQHPPLPLRKHFQMLPPCCRTVRGNARQAKRKSRRDGGDLLEDGAGMGAGGCSKGWLTSPKKIKTSVLIRPASGNEHLIFKI